MRSISLILFGNAIVLSLTEHWIIVPIVLAVVATINEILVIWATSGSTVE